MIDPQTLLTTPLRYLQGRSVLSGFPVSGLSGAPQPSLGSLFTGSAGGGVPSFGGGYNALTSMNALRPVPSSTYGYDALNSMNALRGGAAGAAPGLGFRAAAAEAGSTLPGVLGQAGMRGSLARGAVPLATGYAADKIFGKGDESIAQQAGRGFVRGAGWGVPAAGVVGAIPGVNLVGVPLVAAAAGITGVLGAAADVFDLGTKLGFGGKKKTDPSTIIQTAISAAGLDPQSAQQIQATYDQSIRIAEALYPDSRTDRDAAKQQAFENAKTAIMQVAQATQAGASSAAPQMSAQDMLAQQAMAQSIFAPIANNMEQSGANYATAMQGIKGLPPEYAALANQQAASNSAYTSQLANAYRAQAALVPAISRLTDYQSQVNSLGQQAMQQMYAQSLNPAASAASNIFAPTP